MSKLVKIKILNKILSYLSGCGQIDSAYIVTFIEDSLVAANNYCYGSKSDDFITPKSAFTLSWSGIKNKFCFSTQKKF